MSGTAPERHPRHVVAVTAVVFDAAGRVLLVKGDHRGGSPPGGQVELETPRLLGVSSNLGRPEEGGPAEASRRA